MYNTTPCVCDEKSRLCLRTERKSNIPLKWFEDNYHKINSGKCRLFLSGNKWEHAWAEKEDNTIWELRKVKLLGKTIDNNVNLTNTLAMSL